MHQISNPARPRVLVALLALVAALGAMLAGATPAAAAGTTSTSTTSTAATTTSISGTLSAPTGTDTELTLVMAWAPGATGEDASAFAFPEPDGSFSLTGLKAGRSYQISVLDVLGVMGGGYYTPGALVARAADATLVRAGTTGLAVTAHASAKATDVTVVLPSDGKEPRWSPAGFFVVEPGNGRLMGIAGNALLADLIGPGDGTLPFGEQLASAAATAGAAAQARATRAATTASGEAVELTLPTQGQLAGGRYTVAIPVDTGDDTVDFEDAYYYGGKNRALTRSLTTASSFAGGASRVDVHVLGAQPRTVPTVTGRAQVGAALTAKAGTWSVKGKVSFQWLRDGAPISGATASTYRLRAADRGAAISVRTRLRPYVDGYGHGVRTSVPTNTVRRGSAPTVTGAPTITGVAAVGRTLTASPGTWSRSGLRYAFQWQRDGAAIPGATASTYVLTSADAGRTIRVKVTASKTGYHNGTAYSATRTIRR